MLARLLVACVVLTAGLAGCGSDAPKPNGADRAFLQQMIPHHERAIAVARLGVVAGTDPRVTAFAARIVREQTPEVQTMTGSAAGMSLDLRAGARMAQYRITDTEVAALRKLHGPAFDRRFLRLHIMSEQGAAAMARAEVRDGNDPPSLKLAKSIASAPSTQIPELQRLLAALP